MSAPKNSCAIREDLHRALAGGGQDPIRWLDQQLAAGPPNGITASSRREVLQSLRRFLRPSGPDTCIDDRPRRRLSPRAVGGHYNTFLALEAADPAFGCLSSYFNSCRMVRNQSEYDFAGGIADSDADQLLNQSSSLPRMRKLGSPHGIRISREMTSNRMESNTPLPGDRVVLYK